MGSYETIWEVGFYFCDINDSALHGMECCIENNVVGNNERKLSMWHKTR